MSSDDRAGDTAGSGKSRIARGGGGERSPGAVGEWIGLVGGAGGGKIGLYSL
jgi:hypothetical protein